MWSLPLHRLVSMTQTPAAAMAMWSMFAREPVGAMAAQTAEAFIVSSTNPEWEARALRVTELPPALLAAWLRDDSGRPIRPAYNDGPSGRTVGPEQLAGPPTPTMPRRRHRCSDDRGPLLQRPLGPRHEGLVAVRADEILATLRRLERDVLASVVGQLAGTPFRPSNSFR